jgi:hypothetical protein
VYLNGGPQNRNDPGLVPDGHYYFQVTDPSGAVLLSSDDVACRIVVVSGGRIVGVPSDDANGAGNPSCYHAVGTPNAANGGTAVQLFPYNDTPNAGGEYKAWLTQVSSYNTPCASGNGSHNSYGFCDSYSKTDNFKVRLPSLAYVTVCKFNDLDGNGTQDAGEPLIPHWPITATGVQGGTVNTQTDDNGCVTLTAQGGSAVTLSEGTFGPDWQRTAPADGEYGPFTVSGGVIGVTVNAGDALSAPNFGNTDPACGSPCDLTDLVVTKTAFPALTRTFGWTIGKNVDKTLVKQSARAPNSPTRST